MPKKTRRRTGATRPTPNPSPPRDPLALAVQFALTTETRRAHFLARGELLGDIVTRTLPTVHLAPQTRARILQIAPDLPSLIPLRLPSDRGVGPLWQASTVPDTPLDWDAFLNAYQDACTAAALVGERVQQQAAAEEQRHRRATFDRLLERLRRRVAQFGTPQWQHHAFADLDQPFATIEDILDDPTYQTCAGADELRALAAQLATFEQLQCEQARAAARAEAARYAADQQAWIAAHGSPTLRQRLAGAPHPPGAPTLNQLYRDERRAYENPGYQDYLPGIADTLVPAPTPSASARAEAARVDGVVMLLQRGRTTFGVPHQTWEIVLVDDYLAPGEHIIRRIDPAPQAG